MARSLSLYLADLESAGDYIAEFTHDADIIAYQANAMMQAAVERKFEIIGEALRQMNHHYPEYVLSIVERQQIIDFRNYLIHQYSSVDEDEVWAAVQTKLPEFRRQVASLIEQNENLTASED